jgi:hypothetical protein
MDIPVTGPMLQSKAKKIAQRLQIVNFQTSNGWLESFRARHNINFRSLLGELAGVDLEAAEDWKSKVNQVVSEYPPENLFNAHETGLFYRQMLRKSLVQKGEKCKDGKLSKERLSVLSCFKINLFCELTFSDQIRPYNTYCIKIQMKFFKVVIFKKTVWFKNVK